MNLKSIQCPLSETRKLTHVRTRAVVELNPISPQKGIAIELAVKFEGTHIKKSELTKQNNF